MDHSAEEKSSASEYDANIDRSFDEIDGDEAMFNISKDEARVVRKNDKDGKIIGAYPTKAFLMKDLGTKNKRALKSKPSGRQVDACIKEYFLFRCIIQKNMDLFKTYLQTMREK